MFEEIGLEFARYLQECPPDAPPDSPEFGAFVGGLRPGDPPEGQRYLRQAFTRYQRQISEPAPKRRAEQIVLANLEVGLHEQTRLEPQIREALDATWVTEEELGTRILHVLIPRAARWRPIVERPAAAAIGTVASRAQRVSSGVAREAITRSLMVLTLPGRVLALGLNIDEAYPEALRELDDADLLELLSRFEPVPPAIDDCGARDWADLHQRMHYIVHLFRAFHEHRDLFEAPFTAEQVSIFSRGVVPEGEL